MMNYKNISTISEIDESFDKQALQQKNQRLIKQIDSYLKKRIKSDNKRGLSDNKIQQHNLLSQLNKIDLFQSQINSFSNLKLNSNSKIGMSDQDQINKSINVFESVNDYQMQSNNQNLHDNNGKQNINRKTSKQSKFIDSIRQTIRHEDKSEFNSSRIEDDSFINQDGKYFIPPLRLIKNTAIQNLKDKNLIQQSKIKLQRKKIQPKNHQIDEERQTRDKMMISVHLNKFQNNLNTNRINMMQKSPFKLEQCFEQPSSRKYESIENQSFLRRRDSQKSNSNKSKSKIVDGNPATYRQLMRDVQILKTYRLDNPIKPSQKLKLKDKVYFQSNKTPQNQSTIQDQQFSSRIGSFQKQQRFKYNAQSDYQNTTIDQNFERSQSVQPDNKDINSKKIRLNLRIANSSKAIQQSYSANEINDPSEFSNLDTYNDKTPGRDEIDSGKSHNASRIDIDSWNQNMLSSVDMKQSYYQSLIVDRKNIKKNQFNISTYDQPLKSDRSNKSAIRLQNLTELYNQNSIKRNNQESQRSLLINPNYPNWKRSQQFLNELEQRTLSKEVSLNQINQESRNNDSKIVILQNNKTFESIPEFQTKKKMPLFIRRNGSPNIIV
ncbi:UNKNOWN [Stylonychia lemnae]|uniref:Uncharacterized protein n=1 Tax=Stylonychia lemnae TaxID=5949 RepID=A0A078AA06_STYLE|nr:UNKNOWN [Stylonychia lemnae]|eukprot:CDW78377.1 UNKNOWN [Stylonychia lemnae]